MTRTRQDIEPGDDPAEVGKADLASIASVRVSLLSRSLSVRARRPRMPKTLRTSAGTLIAVTAVAAIGCGSGDTKSTNEAGSNRPASAPARAPKDLKPVNFTVKALADTVHGDTIILRGTAARGATLKVDTAPVTVNQAGKWRKTVHLSLGSNTVQYRASMPGAEPVSGFVGVTR